MNAADISVLLAAAAAIGGLGWFFFGPRRARRYPCPMQYGVVLPKGSLDEIGDMASAAEAAGWDGVFYWDAIAIPDLECGQVLVQIHQTGICGAQINEIAGTKGPDKFLPHLLGHEGGGIVLKTGPGVTHVREADHVVLHWRKGAGIHARPAKYQWDGRTVNSGWVTTFNECAIVSENRLTPIPKSVPFDIAALMGCAVTTALGLINNLAQLKIGAQMHSPPPHLQPYPFGSLVADRADGKGSSGIANLAQDRVVSGGVVATAQRISNASWTGRQSC
jgi:hypothetical protein